MPETFDWLEEEIAAIKTRRFHVVDGPGDGVRRETLDGAPWPLPEAYRSFVMKFGRAKLYKQTGGYTLGVRPIPEAALSKMGEPLLLFGHYRDSGAYFKAALLGQGDESVFESRAGALVRAAGDFEGWIETRCSAVRRRFGKRKWAKIVAGPREFDERERQIVEARKHFTWRVIGHDDTGDTLFEICNGSNLVLPFFSLGVRSTSGRFEGRVWISVAAAEPGTAITVAKDCYKNHLKAEETEIFDLPEPEPEDRADYWEFKPLPSN